MAINPETQYPGKITPSSANYPYGEARNITVPGDGTGTPWEAALVNDIFGYQQALLSEAGIIPTGNPETAIASQYLNALHTLCSRVFDDYDTALAAYTPLGDEQIVYCKGKASAFDGGGGFYQYDLASTTWLRLQGYTNSRGFKNKIINGNFDLWDYATGQTSSGYASDNRWLNRHSGSTKTHTRQAFTLGQTDVPGNPEYYSRTVATTASGASDYVRKSQRIEFVKTFSGETVTLSFWAKADAAKDIAVEFSQNFGTSGSPSAQVNSIGVTTLSLTTSWAKYTVTADIPSISGKTLGTDLNDYLMLTFWFDAGSDYNARTNSLGNQSGTFDIAQVQVEAGPVETKNDDIPIEIERVRSERFAEVISEAVTTKDVRFATGQAIGTDDANTWVRYSRKRARPSVTVSGTFTVSDSAGGRTFITSVSAGNVYETYCNLAFNAPGVFSAGNATIVDLRSGGVLLIDAEL